MSQSNEPRYAPQPLAEPSPGDVHAETFRQQLAADAAGLSPHAAAAIGYLPPEDAHATFSAVRDSHEAPTFSSPERGGASWSSIALDTLMAPFRMLQDAFSGQSPIDRMAELRRQGRSSLADPETRQSAFDLAMGFAGSTTPKVGFTTTPRVAEPGGITTFHGSPHEWETLDPAMVGKGEGNAAFGYGVNYSAEAPNVAGLYSQMAGPDKGHFYRLNITRDPEHFLDWDKTLPEQSPYVKERLKKLGIEPTPAVSPEAIRSQEQHVEALQKTLQVTHSSTIAGMLQRAKWQLRQAKGGLALTGMDIYEELVSKDLMSRKPYKLRQKFISQQLNELGIAGIRYFDAQSRAKMSGTRNYVVFNAKDIQPLSRDGQPLTDKIDLQPDLQPINPVGIVAGAGGSQRQHAITDVNLRMLPYPVALEVAKTGFHIMPRADGQYIGAPEGMATPQQLNAMRRNFDKMAALGVDQSHWYDRDRQTVADLAGMDPARQSRLARSWAVFSAQTPVDQNLGYSIAANNALAVGDMPRVLHTGRQARQYARGATTGDFGLTLKTGPFADALDPSANPSTMVNDRWIARAMRYPEGSKAAEGSVSPQQHAFMDAEGVLATDRANQKKLGGRSDWKPYQLQASAWIGQKGTADGLAFYESKGNIGPDGKKVFSKEEAVAKGMAEAARNFGDFMPKYTAFMTEEAIPYAASGHMSGLELAPDEVKQRYSDAASWLGFNGHDRLMGDLGMLTRSSSQAVGVYHPPGGGPVEFNPLMVHRPLVSLTGPTGKRTLDHSSEELLNAIGAIKAYLGFQGAVPSHMTIEGNQLGRSPAFRIALGRPVTHAEMDQLDQMLGPMGLTAIDRGTSIAVAPFDFFSTGPIDTALKGGLDQQLKTVLPDAMPGKRTGLASTYPSFEEELLKDRAGSGVATEKLLSILDRNPKIFEAADRSQAVADVAKAMFDRDAGIWEWDTGKAGTARQDIQNARQLLEQPNGFTKLREALLKKEIALPAVLLYGVLSSLPGEDGGS